MSYFPLDRDVLSSSLWAQGTPAQFKVFSYLLLSANPRTGIVEDADPAVALRCGLPLDVTVAALDWLASPDPFSRTKDHEGRRIERLPQGGIRVLNYLRRQNKDHSTPRVRRWRQRKKDAAKRVSTVTETTNKNKNKNKNTDTNGETGGQGRGGCGGGDVPTSLPPSRLSHHEADERKRLAERLTTEAGKVAAELGLEPGQVLEEASRIEAGNGHPEKAFRDPLAKGVSVSWIETTLTRGLPALRARLTRPVPL